MGLGPALPKRIGAVRVGTWSSALCVPVFPRLEVRKSISAQAFRIENMAQSMAIDGAPYLPCFLIGDWEGQWAIQASVVRPQHGSERP